jgi:hypothetical protein
MSAARRDFSTQGQIDKNESKIQAERDRHRERLEAEESRYQESMELLAKARGHLVDNQEQIENESAFSAYWRLRKYRIRQGGREVRYQLTGERNEAKSDAMIAAGKVPVGDEMLLRSYQLVLKECGLAGKVVSVGALAAKLKYSSVQMRRYLQQLDDRGWLMREDALGAGRKVRFAAQPPFTEAYESKLLESTKAQIASLSHLRRRLDRGALLMLPRPPAESTAALPQAA